MSRWHSYFKSLPGVYREFSRRYDVGMLSELGRGAGKGGGGGGPIREAGGAFGKLGTKYDVGMLGEPGRGAGKGGGGGGPIREAGGAFGKLGAAREEEYYYKLQRKLLAALKGKLGEENSLREKEIIRHRTAIDDNNKLVDEIDQKLEDCEKRK